MSSEDYRFGFNGKENDNEVKGKGNQQDYGMRIYDPRFARFLSVDPLRKQFPFYTPYQFAGNKPIWAVDLDGLEEFFTTDGKFIGAGDPEDKRKMLVLQKETSKMIKEMTVQERIQLINSQPWDIVTAPTPEMVSRVEKAYDVSEKTEVGFVTGIKNGELNSTELIPGDNGAVDLTSGIESLQSEGYTVLSGAHSHPNGFTLSNDGLRKKLSTLSSPEPSSDDHTNQSERITKGIFKESSFVIGIYHDIVIDFLKSGTTIGGDNSILKSTKKITYYGDSPDQISRLTFSEWKKASEKIYGKDKN